MKRLLKIRELSSFLFLVALFVLVGILNPSFLTADNIVACFNDSVVYILISVGMAFAIIVGEIDVSVGANLGFTATVVSCMLRDGQNWALAFITGILIGVLFGLFNGWGVAVMGVPLPYLHPWHQRRDARHDVCVHGRCVGGKPAGILQAALHKYVYREHQYLLYRDGDRCGHRTSPAEEYEAGQIFYCSRG